MSSAGAALVSTDAQKGHLDQLQSPSPLFASHYASQESFIPSHLSSSFSRGGSDTVDSKAQSQVASGSLSRQSQGNGFRRGDYFNFVPSILLRGLDSRGMLPQPAEGVEIESSRSRSCIQQLHPFSDVVFGSLLLVDISGFTRLSSKLTAEELKLRINKYFTKLLDTISYYHGDVVKFCGDALIVLWPTDVSASEAMKSTAVRVATMCALHLIADCSGVPDTSNPNGALKIHCGVSCGNIHCMMLGDDDRWEFIVSGKALQDMGEAESAAALGEVCLSSSAYALVNSVFDGISYHSGVCMITEIKTCSPGCDRCARLNYRFLKIEPKANASEHIGGSSAGAGAGKGASVRPKLSIAASSMSSLKSVTQSSDQLNPASLTSPGQNLFLSTHAEQDNSGSGSLKLSPSALPSGLSITRPKSVTSDDDGLSRVPHLPTSPKPESTMKPNSLPPIDRKGFNQSNRSLLSYLSSMLSINDAKVAVDDEIGTAEDVSVTRKSRNGVGLDGSQTADVLNSGILDESHHNKDALVDPNVSPYDSLSVNRAVGSNSTRPAVLESSSSFEFRATPDSSMPMPDAQLISNNFHSSEDENEAQLYSFLSRYRHGPGAHKTVSRLIKKASSVMTSQTSSLNSAEIVEDVYNICRVFVPHPVRVAIESDTVEFLSEIRVVSTMFVEILGLDEDLNEGNFERPQKVLVAILRVLKKFGGGLRQFVVDDKGCVAIIGYGIPGHSHEDNCLRAIDTALTLHRRLQALKLDCKIGISSNRVYCGLVGSSYRCEFAMMGASVNLAARLMSNCKSVPILVESNVYKVVSDSFNFTKLPKINAKGYRHPISVYSPHGRSNEEYFDSEEVSIADSIAFVGREAIVKELLDALDAAWKYSTSMRQSDGSYSNETSGCQSFMIESLPGLGKSKCLQHIQHQAIARAQGPFNVLAITAPNPRAQSSMKYEVVKMYLHQLFGLDPALMALHWVMKNEASTETSLERLPTSQRQSADFTGGVTEMHYPPQAKSTSSAEQNAGLDSYTDKVSIERRRAESQLSDSYREIERWLTNHSTPEDVFSILRVGSLSLVPRQLERPSGKQTGYKIIIAYGDKEAVLNGTSPQPFKYSCNRDGMSEPSLQTVLENYEILDVKTLHVLELLPLLSKVLPIYSQQCYDLYVLPSAAKLELLDALIIFTLERAFLGAPWLMLLDHVHLCDVTSLDILHQLIVISKKNLVFIGALDSMQIAGAGDEDSDPLLELRKLCKCLELRPLNIAETQLLFDAIIDKSVRDVKPSSVNFDDCILEISSRSEGNAFVAVTLIFRLKESILAKTFTDIASLDFVAGEASITSFDSLSRSNQVILKLASIIGLTFRGTELSKLMTAIGVSSSGVNLSTGLQELVQIGFLAVVPDEDAVDAVNDAQVPLTDQQYGAYNAEDLLVNAAVTKALDDATSKQYRFTNTAVHDNIYELMLENQRKIAHYYMGLILEPQFADHEDQMIRRIVYHYSHSNNLEKKLEFLARAISYSLKNKDYSSVKSYLENVIEATAGKPVEELLRQRKSTNKSNRDATSSNQRYHFSYSSAVNNYSTASNSGVNASVLRRWASARMPSVLSAPAAWLRYEDLSDSLPSGSSSPERVACWIAETSVIFFRLGNFRRSYNFALLALRFFGVFSCDIQNISEAKAKQKRGWLCLSVEEPLICDISKLATRSVDLILRLLIKLAMLTLLCGRSSEARGYLRLMEQIKAYLEMKITTQSMSKKERSYYASSGAESIMGSDDDYLLIGSGNILYALNDIYAALALLASRSSPREHNASSLAKLCSSLGLTSRTIDTAFDLNAGSESLSSMEKSIQEDRGSRNSHKGSFYSCLLHITRALWALANGRLPEAFTNLDQALSYLSADSNEDDIASRQIVVLLSAWVALMGGKREKARVLCIFVLDYARSHKQSLLLKWSLELLMMLQILSAVMGTDVNLFLRNSIEIALIEVKNATARDRPSAASSALLAFSYAYERNDTLALPLARFAIDRLAQRSPITPVSGMFVFLAGYAAALLMDHQWQRLLLAHSEEQCYEEIHKSPRIMVRSDEVVREALTVLASIALNHQPILSVLHEALRQKHANALVDLRSTGGLHPVPRLFPNSVLQKYDKFIFGTSFLTESIVTSDQSASFG